MLLLFCIKANRVKLRKKIKNMHKEITKKYFSSFSEFFKMKCAAVVWSKKLLKNVLFWFCTALKVH